MDSRLAQPVNGQAPQQCLLQEQIADNHVRTLATLRAIAESKNQYLAKISHDFRTPLQIIVTTIDLLSVVLGKNADNSVIKAIEKLDSASNQLLASSNTLAEYLGRYSRETKIKTESLELIEFLSECAEPYKTLANQKGLALLFSHDESTIDVSSDAVRLQQIVTNLIDNAVKYTIIGSISLQCKVGIDGRIIIVVKDTGPGISEECQKFIFEPWFSEAQPGHETGLGLAIAKANADAIDATIQMKSILGLGTEITLTLPRKP